MSVDVDEETGEIDFEREVEDAVASLPRELRDVISNVAIVVEMEPPPGQPLLGLYQGIPLTRRGSGYSGVLPDKITIYRGPLERLYGADRESLRARSGVWCSTKLLTTSGSATSVSRSSGGTSDRLPRRVERRAVES